jgi:hypothetical protein
MLVIALAASLGCSSKEAGQVAAQKEAEAELARKLANKQAAPKIKPPVAGGRKVACDQLIDPTAFTQALMETSPVVVKDNTASDAEAVSVCSIVRGGEKLSQVAQQAMLKKNPRLGVLPGDEMCSVTAYCSTIEEEKRFFERCKELGFREDNSMGTVACVKTEAKGADDVLHFRFLDEDTRCVLKVRGGPSMSDNDAIRTCARAARDLIVPASIAAR